MSKIRVGDKVWHKSFLDWVPGTVLVTTRFRALVRDDSYKTLLVTHWRWKSRLHRID